ncbi:MAG TPA: hypothetical protein VKB55_06435 [Nocardioidaceae bacterium]|nr:hypothetical protein [Nocardioidaceae bacterium]
MAQGSVDHWQKSLDEDGSVVIRSSRQNSTLALAGCVALVLLAFVLALTGSLVGIVAGLVIVVGVALWAPRITRTVFSGQPHLVVTPEEVSYGRQSVRWSEVTEIVRHSMTIRGNIQTYVWLIHGRDRLRLPQTLQADMTELELWLRSVQSRRGRASA